jgi:hypothetical protein
MFRREIPGVDLVAGGDELGSLLAVFRGTGPFVKNDLLHGVNLAIMTEI